MHIIHTLRLFTPLVFVAHLRFFLGRKIVLDVEGGANVLRGLSLDHARHRGTGEIQEGLDVEVVGGEDQFKEEDLFDIDKIGVPLLDHVLHVLRLEGLFDFRHGLGEVVFAELEDLLEDLRLDVGEGELDVSGLLLVFVVCGGGRNNDTKSRKNNN